jgi:methylisocitrate lyase
MTTSISAGAAFRAALNAESPLQIVGTINAYTALIAERVGFKAIYLSCAGVAHASLGLPDVGITTLNDILDDATRITNAVDIPLLVDADTGFGGAFNIARAVQDLTRAGVAGMHIGDQQQIKRYGHHTHKSLIKTSEMTDRLKAAVDARLDQQFVIMARTDALSMEGMIAAIERAEEYQAAGADIILFEGVRELKQYHALTSTITIPVMANLNEFGITPLFTLEELTEAGIDIALYPLSAFRAMNTAALKTYFIIREEGSQFSMLEEMQTQDALADFLNAAAYEDKPDDILLEENDEFTPQEEMDYTEEEDEALEYDD